MKPYYRFKKDIVPEDFDLTDEVASDDTLLENKLDYKNMKQYSFGKGLWKAVINVILFAIPIFLTSFPQWADLTLGGVLVLLMNFVKVRYNLIK